jgi:protein ImuB
LLAELVSGGGRAAVADVPAVAHAVARFGGASASVVPSGEGIPAGYPIEALRLPLAVSEGLRRLGLDRVGLLAGVPRGPLVRRFGPVLALRLDQAAGRQFEPIAPVVPEELIQCRLAFAEPLLTAEAFLVAIGRLVPSVCADLERAGLGARRLDLLFERLDGAVQAVRIGTARPVREPGHLLRMLRERLEQVDPGPGVEAMRLVVSLADPVGFAQGGLVRTAGLRDIAPLVDVLANRLGESRVYRVAPVESHVPERSFRRVAPLSRAGAWPKGLRRPVRVLDPPQPIDTVAADGVPSAFTWRRVRHVIREAEGPERIAGEWWRGEGAVRDYFRVRVEDGRRFWLFRGGGQRAWFLHGFF